MIKRASHNPDHLNSITRIIEPSTRGFLITCGTSLVALFAWSVLGKIPYTVSGSAVFVQPNTINSINSEVSGNIFFAKDLSETTRTNLSTLPTLIAKASKREDLGNANMERELVNYAYRYVELTTEAMADVESIAKQSQIKKVNASKKDNRPDTFNSGEPIAYILDRATASEFLNSLQTYQSLVYNYNKLKKTSDHLLRLYQRQLDDVENLADLGVLPKSQIVSAEQSVLTYKTNQVETESNLVNSMVAFTADLIKSAGGIQVMPSGSGVVLSQNVQSGDYIEASTPIVEVSSTEKAFGPDNITVFVPVKSSQGLKKGMQVLVSPSNADINKYGAIKASIVDINSIPMAKNVADSLLGSDSLATKAYGDEVNMIALTVGLEKGKTKSSYKWSSSDGPPFPIAVGTEGTATVIIDYTRPISLVMPFIRSITGIGE